MTWIGKSVRISKSTYERLVAYQHELRVRGKSEALKMIFDVYDSLGGSRVAPRVPSQDSSPPEPPEISVVVDEAGKPSFKEAAGTKLSDLTQPEVIRYIMR